MSTVFSLCDLCMRVKWSMNELADADVARIFKREGGGRGTRHYLWHLFVLCHFPSPLTV